MTQTTEAQTVHTMTEQEATDEALLLLTRKLQRLHPTANADLMAQLPEGARTALRMAENRADRVRDQHGIKNLAYQVDEIEDDEI
jgi:hypothetical protein